MNIDSWVIALCLYVYFKQESNFLEFLIKKKKSKYEIMLLYRDIPDDAVGTIPKKIQERNF